MRLEKWSFMKHILSTRDYARCSIFIWIVNIHYVLLFSGHCFSQDNMSLIHSSQQPRERGMGMNISNLQMRKSGSEKLTLCSTARSWCEVEVTVSIRHLALDFMLCASARCYFRLTATLSCQAANLSIGQSADSLKDGLSSPPPQTQQPFPFCVSDSAGKITF